MGCLISFKTISVFNYYFNEGHAIMCTDCPLVFFAIKRKRFVNVFQGGIDPTASAPESIANFLYKLLTFIMK